MRGEGGIPSHFRRGGVTPPQVRGGTPLQVGGVPHPRSGQGGTPSSHGGGTWGTPQPEMGYPQTCDRVPPRPEMEYPPDLGWGTPPDLRWVPPRPEMGYPQTWDRVPPDLRWGTPYPDLRWGTPLPRPEMGYPLPASVERHTDLCQNITLPRTSYTGGKNVSNFSSLAVFGGAPSP